MADKLGFQIMGTDDINIRSQYILYERYAFGIWTDWSCLPGSLLTPKIV